MKTVLADATTLGPAAAVNLSVSMRLNLSCLDVALIN